VWDDRDTLERVVRVVRTTRPDVIVTMDPSPTLGNHGHHQLAARLAVEAFEVAADPSTFRSQLTQEGLTAWRVERIFSNDATGTYGDETGPRCVTSFRPAERTDETFGVWAGARARNGKTWEQIAVEAQREYASQGWAGFEDAPANPARIGCVRFTQIAARVPYDGTSTRRDAVLQGATVAAAACRSALSCASRPIASMPCRGRR
jgi:LmbE family N-acetylglucosaminyl deacetylase